MLIASKTMTVYLKNTEATHRAMYTAHHQLTGGAQTLHSVAVELYEKARHDEDRRELKSVIETLEAARSLADQAWLKASDARLAITRLTGCDGTCSERAA